jgi:benzoate-CoA ligase
MLELNLSRQFNAAEYFVDRNVGEGRGDKTAILFEDQAVSYDGLMENVNRVANVLTELGVGMEDRVMLLVRDTPEMLYSFYGAMKAGAVAIPHSHQYFDESAGFSVYAQRQPGPGSDC